MSRRDTQPAPSDETAIPADPGAVVPDAVVPDAVVIVLRGHPAILDARVAAAFGVQTREINQAVARNPHKFTDQHAFVVNEEERDFLRSAGLISKPGRGGSRALPWAVTRKGAMRLATIMKTPRAIQATDIFIDVFDEVLHQVQASQGQLTIAAPSRLVETETDRKLIGKLRSQLSDAVGRLLDTVVEPQSRATVADELREVSAGAVNHLIAWLKGRSVANDRIEAETLLVIEQAQDMYERRQADLAEKALDRERKALENLRLRIDAAKDVMALYRQLEPSALVDLTRGYAVPLPGLPRASATKPAPATKDDA